MSLVWWSGNPPGAVGRESTVQGTLKSFPNRENPSHFPLTGCRAGVSYGRACGEVIVERESQIDVSTVAVLFYELQKTGNDDRARLFG